MNRLTAEELSLQDAFIEGARAGRMGNGAALNDQHRRAAA